MIFVTTHCDKLRLNLNFDCVSWAWFWTLNLYCSFLMWYAFLKLMCRQLPFSVQSSPAWWKVLKWWYADTSPFMAFRCVFLCVCVFLCLHAGYKAAWCLRPEICADQTLLDSSPTQTNRWLSLVFLARRNPFALYRAWLMLPPQNADIRSSCLAPQSFNH